MVRPANGSLRDATTNAAVSTDDVDLGWDDVPASTTAPPPPTDGVSPKVSEIRALSRSLENANFRRHQVSPMVIISAMVAAVAVVVASVAKSQFPSVAAHAPEVVATPLKEPAAQPLPEPPRAEPAPSAIVTTSAGPAAPPQEIPPLEIPAGAAHVNAVTVTVKVIPENAVIFRAGKKLSSSAMELSVEHGKKERLIAFHDGYLPSQFTLDGSRDTVTVRLQRAPSPQASAPAATPAPGSGSETAPAPASAADASD